ncbi:NAD-dependent epimerase/dehydratase family protein [Dehalococcoidia bacterium]|nr:NAD-dependent epimerase/dehydratase family protein [Dehalococcoidia bacterium]
MTAFLITGGAGFLGINLARFLLSKGHRVASLDIAKFAYPDVQGQVCAIQGDIRDRDTVEQAMEGAEVLVHTAAALPLYKRQDIRTTDIDGTQNVMDAAHRHGLDRAIHISSTAVYGIPDHHPLCEDDPLEGVGAYGEAKIAAEQICLQFRSRGLCLPILRPKSFVGPERLGVFALLYDWAKDGRSFPMLGKGNNRYQLLDVEDLCEAILLASNGDKAAVNNTFNIGARDFTTMREDYQSVLDEAGFGKRIKALPAAPAIFTLRILEKMHLSPLYRWVYETAAKDSFVSIEKAERLLGYNPKHSNRQALIRNYRWYVNNLDQFQGSSGVSHRTAWKQGILGLAKLFF